MSWIVYGAVAYLAYRWVTAEQSKAKPAKAKSDRGKSDRAKSTKSKRGQGGPRSNVTGPPDPYVLLEIAPSATMDEVRHAYQEKVAAYHPDRVANAAPELRELAETRTKELNAAYDAIRRQRGA
jgi:DnaJ like chaperone protein